MDTFIDQVIKEVKEKHGNELRNLCIVFPTRRACLIFRNRFAQGLDKPVWSPGITAIGDFVSRHATYPVSDEIPLLLTLFEVYRKHWPDQDFGKFYAWGQMLINDFDEIDKQLSDPSGIFSNISELKKIDAAFLPDPSSLRWINDFIASMNEEKLTKIQQQFTNTWNRLRQIYIDYNILLNQKGLAYEGKSYRDITKKLKDGNFISPWSGFLFAGFYGFSRIEEQLIEKLSEKYPVSVIWDSDSYYVNNIKHEAGYYFRKSPLFKTNPSAISHFSNSHKKFEITGVPLQAGQAKYTGELLAKLISEGNLDVNNTAIILADENMLFPILYSLPESIETINVTMGYPLQQSQYAELFRVLHDLHRHENNNSNFHIRAVKRVFNHPLFKNKFVTKNKNEDYNNYLSADQIAILFDYEHATLVFKHITDSGGVINYLQEVLRLLRDEIISRSGHAIHFEDKIIDYIISELNLLYSHISEHLKEINTETAWQMASECVAGLKVPFSGEPVLGLQIMGFLETRALDFKTVIILNVNEGTLPSTASNKSFIPFSLRKGYGLSTYQDQDASFSYHFYRLLHKAENIYLIYNSEVSKMNGGEPSRFLLQVSQELKRFMGENMIITNGLINTPIIPEVITPISIIKDEAVLFRLKDFLRDENGIHNRTFSSSSITTYISCSLKFYYRYVAGLKEKESDEVTIEDHIFGTILHRAMELLYGTVNEVNDVNIIDKLILKSDNAVDTAFKEIYNSPVEQLEGSDILLGGVIRELTKRILIADKKDVPFKITGLEEKLGGNFISGSVDVLLYGSIDRIDEAAGVTRIIDYKTGKVDLKSSGMQELFSDPEKKALFQLYFYALLYNLNFPGKNIKTGFYLARNLTNGITWPGDGSVISDESLAEYKLLLAEKISEIMDPAKEFSQTPDIKQCEYCPYNIICNR